MNFQGKVVITFLILISSNALTWSDPPVIGERPAVEEHLDQSLIESGHIKFRDLVESGEHLFKANYNFLDGQGRPASTGTGAPRVPDEPEFIRTSGPDGNSCSGCHAQPRIGGSGDFVANVFTLAEALDPVTTSVAPTVGNERNTLGMMGAGPIEMLALEMSLELIAIREQAKLDAAAMNMSITRDLIAKGVDFGTITVLPNGKVDPSDIEGVDWDLIIKPFGQKGTMVSIREFSNKSQNQHFGMQSVERFGLNVDADLDGIVNELSVGDITALTLFQAALNTPGQVLPKDPQRRQAVIEGEQLFEATDCSSCHRKEFALSQRTFSDPNPFNPPGNLTLADVSQPFEFDMTKRGSKPRLEKLSGGRALVRPFTDLKRHNLNDGDFDHFDNELLSQGTLNGFAPAGDFTVPPAPRPTGEFLTRKLWDVGSSEPYGHRGDLTTITEAIYFHGGAARTSRDTFFARPQEEQDKIIEFLKSLRVLPDGSPRVVRE